MAKAQLATKIDANVKQALEEICNERGLKMNRFIEDAILDRIEELEDLGDLRKLRNEKFRSFEDVLADLKSDGKL